MKCPNCGAENPIHQLYCRGCGRKIVVDYGMIQDAVAYDDKEAKARKTTRALVPVIAILLVANVIVWIYGSQLRIRIRAESLPTPSAVPPEMPVAPLEVPPLPRVPGAQFGPLPLPGNVGTPSGRLGFRRGEMKEALHRAHGGSPEALKAIRRGLRCLAARQRKSGEWSVSGGWEGGRERWGNPAVTGLAVLAILGDGHVWTQVAQGAGGKDIDAKLAEAAGLGVRSLITRQDASGRVGGTEKGHMYNQGIAAAALSEAYAMTGLAQLREPAQRAVDYVVKAQRPNGGWDYVAKDGRRADMSVTVWQIEALRAARTAGLEVPPETLKRVETFVHTMTSSETSVVQYETERFVSTGTPVFSKFGPTAMALAARAMLGLSAGSKDDTGQAAVVQGRAPAWDATSVKEATKTLHAYGYWYHGTTGIRPLGERRWREWYVRVSDALLAAQDKDEGSWPPAGHFAHRGGRVYTTALAVLTLEATYRYP